MISNKSEPFDETTWEQMKDVIHNPGTGDREDFSSVTPLV